MATQTIVVSKDEKLIDDDIGYRNRASSQP